MNETLYEPWLVHVLLTVALVGGLSAGILIGSFLNPRRR